MSGVGLAELRRPPDRYNPALRDDFPTRRCCFRRDRMSADALRQAANAPHLIGDGEQVCDLAWRLDYGRRGEEPALSRAAQAHYGSLQMRTGGAIWGLIDGAQQSGQEVSFVTLCPRGGDVTPGEVLSVDPRPMGRQLNADLDRIARSQALARNGWSILFLDCEYQNAEGVFRLHWHGFASGSEIEAVDGLRHLRKYRSPRADEEASRDPVRFRVQMTRKPLSDLGYLCTYPIKREWRSRPGCSNQPGNRDRSWPRPLPEHLRALERLFYDRWSIQDIAVVRGLRVINGRLTPTRR